MDGFGAKSRLAVLLEGFGEVADARAPWRVAHPLPKVLLLVVCATIADCDDFESIADWGEAHLSFLRRFAPYDHGVPGARWINILMKRMDPDLLAECFLGWAATAFPGAPAQIAIDGKTLRRSHDRAAGVSALHLVCAFATGAKLVLAQEAVGDKTNEPAAIPRLLQRLSAVNGVAGALVSIDAIACNPKIAGDILAAGGDYLLAVKDNQSGLKAELQSFFDAAPVDALDRDTAFDKGHGRIEERHTAVSDVVDWMDAGRRFPGEARFPGLAWIVRVQTRVETRGGVSEETRYFISSRPLCAAAMGQAVRAHWAIETSLHWVLNLTFKDDLARTRTGHGAKNMSLVRHFAFNLLKGAHDKTSLRLRRKKATWSPDYLAQLLSAPAR